MADSRTLSYTAEQIDAILAAAQRCSNRNLLDNWYFANPVDQRGGYVVPPGLPYRKVSDYSIVGNTDKYYTVSLIDNTGNPHFYIDGVEYYIDHNHVSTAYVRGYTGEGYTIDRWPTHGDSTVTINTDSLTFFASGDSNIVQTLENALKEDTLLTFSVLNKTGTVYIRIRDTEWGDYGVSQGTGDGVVAVTATIPKGKIPMVQFYSSQGQSITVKAAKLELGDHQTLAHQDENGNWVLNEIPDYGEQLARCQRYYQLYSSADKRPVKAVDCRPTMRVDPVQGTIVIDRTTYYYNSAEL